MSSSRLHPIPEPGSPVDAHTPDRAGRRRLSAVAFSLLASALLCVSSGPAARMLHAAEPGPLTASVQPFVDRQELAGAVMAIATPESIVTVQTAGWADIEAQKPMQPDTLFWIASQSKVITAAAVMVLVDEGRISLDDPVEQHLPEFKTQLLVGEKKPTRKMTIRNLLSHTSGLPFKSSAEEPTLDCLPLADCVRSYALTPLEYEPGTKYQYSNAGINTAARVIEVVTGTPFETFLEERLTKPVGMVDTTFWPTEQQVARLAKSYKAGPDNKGLVATTVPQLRYPLTDKQQRFPMPGGGLFSTAHDVARFYQMLLQDGRIDGQRILSEASVKELTRRQTAPEIKESYGLGLSVSPTTFGHGGAFGTNTMADRNRKVISIWLVQHANFPGEGAKSQEAFRQAFLKETSKK